MEKVVLNSKIINDEEHIYFSLKDNYFDFIKFEISDDLQTGIQKGIKKIEETYLESPSAVFIPFAKYDSFAKENKDRFLNHTNYLIDTPLEIHVLIPDRMMDK